MSGGAFNYLQNRYEWGEMVEKIQNHIETNEYEFKNETLEEFKLGLEAIKKARIYMQRIDYLLSFDDSEKSFHERLKKELNA